MAVQLKTQDSRLQTPKYPLEAQVLLLQAQTFLLRLFKQRLNVPSIFVVVYPPGHPRYYSSSVRSPLMQDHMMAILEKARPNVVISEKAHLSEALLRRSAGAELAVFPTRPFHMR